MMINSTRRLLAVLALILPCVAFAAPSLGELSVIGSPQDALFAEVVVDGLADAGDLSAAAVLNEAPLAGGQEPWDQAATFTVVNRGSDKVLQVRSRLSVGSTELRIKVGVQVSGEQASRSYHLYHDGRAWSTTAPKPAPVATSALQISPDLHFVVPFADGRVNLGPKGRAAVKKLANMSTEATRIQIKGWAGGTNADSRQEMAFNRAFAVQYRLISQGVDRDVLRIMRPDLSVMMLDGAGVKSPQVVVTLIGSPETALQADAEAADSVPGRTERQNLPAPRLAMATTLSM